MIQIDGLTDRQMAILDVIWNMETQEEVNDWLDSMDEFDRMECDTLAKMLIYAVVDEATSDMRLFPDAAKIIQQVQY